MKRNKKKWLMGIVAAALGLLSVVAPDFLPLGELLADIVAPLPDDAQPPQLEGEPLPQESSGW